MCTSRPTAHALAIIDTIPGAADNTQSSNISLSHSDPILNASGYVTARRMATVSAEIMGLIKEVNVEEGMAVTEG